MNRTLAALAAVTAIVAACGSVGPATTGSPQSSSAVPPTADVAAVCARQVNEPLGSPSMMPPEPGTDTGTPREQITPLWSPSPDAKACTATIAFLLATGEFLAVSGGHHIEVGLADTAESAHKECPSECWRVQYFDYSLEAGYQALIQVDPPSLLALTPHEGVPPSPPEADRAIQIALADNAVRTAMGKLSGWTPWLSQATSGSDEDPCGSQRCLLLRSWDSDGRLLAARINLTSGALAHLSLP